MLLYGSRVRCEQLGWGLPRDLVVLAPLGFNRVPISVRVPGFVIQRRSPITYKHTCIACWHRVQALLRSHLRRVFGGLGFAGSSSLSLSSSPVEYRLSRTYHMTT